VQGKLPKQRILAIKLFNILLNKKATPITRWLFFKILLFYAAGATGAFFFGLPRFPIFTSFHLCPPLQ
jgi:hypothetical protein